MARGLAAGGAALMAGLLGCDPVPPRLDKLTVGHAYQASFGLLYVAEKAGFFKEEGLEVEFLRFGSGRDAMRATLEAKADIATPFDTPVALALLEEQPIRVLSSLGVLMSNAQVMGHPGRGIRSPADLQGHRIGFIPNTSGEYVMSMVLANAGIAETQVTRVAMNHPGDLTQALVKGDVDAAALWAPFTFLARQGLGGEALRGFTSPTYVETALLTTTEEVIKHKRPAIVKLMRGLVRAEHLALLEPQKTLQVIQAFLPDTPAEVVEQTWRALQPQIRLDNQMVVSLENQMHWFLKKQGREVGYALNLRPYLVDDVLRGLQPQAVTLKPMR